MNCVPPVMPSKQLVSSRRAEQDASLVGVARELVRLKDKLRELESSMRSALDQVFPDRRESAKNLVHYVALRQHDLRDLQVRLAQLGLTSLGRSESCVMDSLLAVSQRAHESLALRGHRGAARQLGRAERERGSAMSPETAKQRLHQHTRDMLGSRPADRHIYIMVTAPTPREADRAWMVKMLRAGMNVLRINCAHDSEHEWGQIIDALREARRETGTECRVIMDLAGPKIRTGPIAGARRIATWKPSKDELGNVTTEARVVIRRLGALLPEGGVPCLLMHDEDLAALRKGDELRFSDVRGKKRSLRIHAVTPEESIATARQRAYLVDHVAAHVHRAGRRRVPVTVTIGAEPGAAIDVTVGDTLLLTQSLQPGKPARRDRQGRVASPAVVACVPPAALEHLAKAQRVLFDDGRICTIVESVPRKAGGAFSLRVLRTHKATSKLRAEKGINLPDTLTTIPSLSDEDRRALRFVAEHADAVSLSFVRTPDDVRALHRELDRLGRSNIGVVLKIETRAGFENLPRLLLEGLRRPPLAVMIARGDLAVEVGFERLAELQEEILWLCEASHVPTIWATQVLDTLARTGVPSRAEVTDASASVAAECVMLNKGPFVHEAVAVLSDILRRMEKHHYKKRSLFRKLHVSTFAKR